LRPSKRNNQSCAPLCSLNQTPTSFNCASGGVWTKPWLCRMLSDQVT
jgi:hypothetical protein